MSSSRIINRLFINRLSIPLAALLAFNLSPLAARAQQSSERPAAPAPASSPASSPAASATGSPAASAAGSPATAAVASAPPVKWSEALKQKPEWYGGEEAARIADNLLLYQREVGGWPKNLDMARPLSEKEKTVLRARQKEEDANIDNGATYTQLVFLARVYTARRQERHREAFLRGVDYLLRAQYPNGGWPQYFPVRKGYYTHITFNDGAMVGVMKLLRDIAQRKSAYTFVDEERRLRAERAVARGVELILKSQVVVAGRRTVWSAQHDEVTLEPAPARKFEPASLTGGESVGIVRFLMDIKEPNEQVRAAVEAAVEWFRKSKIDGIRWVEKRDPSKDGGFVRTAVRDPEAPPLWARFYELGTNRPIFIGRDSRIKYDVMEIEEERRNGYRWYTDEPQELLEREYPAWQKKWPR